MQPVAPERDARLSLLRTLELELADSVAGEGALLFPELEGRVGAARGLGAITSVVLGVFTRKVLVRVRADLQDAPNSILQGPSHQLAGHDARVDSPRQAVAPLKFLVPPDAVHSVAEVALAVRHHTNNSVLQGQVLTLARLNAGCRLLQQIVEFLFFRVVVVAEQMLVLQRNLDLDLLWLSLLRLSARRTELPNTEFYRPLRAPQRQTARLAAVSTADSVQQTTGG